MITSSMSFFVLFFFFYRFGKAPECVWYEEEANVPGHQPPGTTIITSLAGDFIVETEPRDRVNQLRSRVEVKPVTGNRIVTFSLYPHFSDPPFLPLSRSSLLSG